MRRTKRKNASSELSDKPFGPAMRQMQREVRFGLAPKEIDVIDKQFVQYLIERVSDFEKRSRPSGGDATAVDKDSMAQESLATCGLLLQHLAGWALDHQRGLAAEGLNNLRLQEIKTPVYEEAKAVVDNHIHEKVGRSDRPIDPSTDRRILYNILKPLAGFLDLPAWTTEGLKALDAGEVVPLFQRGSSDNKRTYREQILKLRAVQFVEYEHAKGLGLTKAREIAAGCFSVDAVTIRSWGYRLPETLGSIVFDREISYARFSGTNHKKGFDLIFGEEHYGFDVLKKAGEMYLKLLKKKQG